MVNYSNKQKLSPNATWIVEDTDFLDSNGNYIDQIYLDYVGTDQKKHSLNISHLVDARVSQPQLDQMHIMTPDGHINVGSLARMAFVNEGSPQQIHCRRQEIWDMNLPPFNFP